MHVPFVKRPLRKRLVSSFVLALPLVAFAACASSGSREGAPAQVDEMVTWIERVYVEAERSREAIADAANRLSYLTGGRFDKDPAPVVYARFVQATDVAEQQAKRFREVVTPMLSAAEPVFRQWQKDVETIGNERLRQLSETRFAVAKERYDALKAAAVPSQDAFDKLVRELRDHAAFLAHDLNSGALDQIQGEVKTLAKTAIALDENLETTMAAARVYVSESALPAAAPAPAR